MAKPKKPKSDEDDTPKIKYVFEVNGRTKTTARKFAGSNTSASTRACKNVNFARCPVKFVVDEGLPTIQLCASIDDKSPKKVPVANGREAGRVARKLCNAWRENTGRPVWPGFDGAYQPQQRRKR